LRPVLSKQWWMIRARVWQSLAVLPMSAEQLHDPASRLSRPGSFRAAFDGTDISDQSISSK
jgi:hypothetical protein